MNPLTAIVAPVVNAISGAYKSRQERKQAVAKVKSAIEIRKTDSDFNLRLKDKEWEQIGKEAESGTIKDEIVTIIILAPLVALIAGALVTPELTLFEAAQLSIREINSLDTTSGYGLILFTTVLAGLGIKAWRS